MTREEYMESKSGDEWGEAIAAEAELCGVSGLMMIPGA